MSALSSSAPTPLLPEDRALGGHVPALDGVRGLAVLLVLAHDFNVIGDLLSLPARAINLLLDLGWVGVQLFFVLSGFLITGILLDTRKADNYYRAFLGRRVVRIFPLYYAVLVAAFVVMPLVAHPISGHEHQIWLWTYLSNWAEPFDRGVPLFPHFWSLAIEEQFYLVWPFLMGWLSPRAVLRVCIGMGVVALASRLALRVGGAGPTGAYMFTICRTDAIAAGAAAAVLLRTPRAVAVLEHARRSLRWSALASLVAVVLLTRGAPRAGVLTQTFGYTAFALAFAALIFDVALLSRGSHQSHGGDWLIRMFHAAPLRSAGKYSYAMYVFHMPLHLLIGLPLLAHLTADASLGLALAYLGATTLVTFVAAVLSYHLLEKHFLRLKRWFVPSRSG